MRAFGLTLLVLGATGCAASEMDTQPDPSGETDERVDPRMLRVRARVQQALSRSATNLRMRKAVDGSDYVEVVGGFQHATVLVIGDAGVTSHCLSDEREALRLLERAPE